MNLLKLIQKEINKLFKLYSKSSLWGKILVLTLLLILIVVFFKNIKVNKGIEGFEQNDSFLVKTGDEIYDNFYASIYDYLVYNNLKNDYEVGQIINKTSPSSESVILDIGCGTGHHVANLSANNLNVLGIDKSPEMIQKAKENYPQYKFKVGDALNSELFGSNSFTHILTMYFTIYYIKDKSVYFENVYKWLMPGGYLIIHLVDRKKFDPILPPGNPLLLVSPQKYANKRITTTKVKFDNFAYNADFQLDEQNNIAYFIEKFKNDVNNKVRKNEHVMYMPDSTEIVNEAQSSGFILQGIVDLMECQYEYQYLYIFVKPN